MNLRKKPPVLFWVLDRDPNIVEIQKQAFLRNQKQLRRAAASSWGSLPPKPKTIWLGSRRRPRFFARPHDSGGWCRGCASSSCYE